MKPSKVINPRRRKIYDKTNGRCAYCGVILGQRWEIDHIQAQSQGGRNALANLIASCAYCNRQKRYKSVEEFRDFITERASRQIRETIERLKPAYDLIGEHSAMDLMAKIRGLADCIESYSVVFYQDTVDDI